MKNTYQLVLPFFLNESEKKSVLTQELSIDNPVKHEIDGRAIKKMRAIRGWSRSVLAKGLNVKRQTIINYESGLVLLTAEELLGICTLFCVTPARLIYNRDRQRRKNNTTSIDKKLNKQRRIALKMYNSSAVKPNEKSKVRKEAARSIPWNSVIKTGFESNRRKH